MSFYAHPSAIVDEGARIGTDTKIWHFSHVMGGAVIGDRCSLGQNVFVADNVTIGDGVRIQNNVSVYEGVTLEDDVFCGPSMVFTNVKTPRSAFPVGRDGYGTTVVRRGATIGANATIVCGVEVGAWSLIGAGSVVAADVPAHALVVGVPGRVIGHVCTCGERLPAGVDVTCAACDRSYRIEDGEVTET